MGLAKTVRDGKTRWKLTHSTNGSVQAVRISAVIAAIGQHQHAVNLLAEELLLCLRLGGVLRSRCESATAGRQMTGVLLCWWGRGQMAGGGKGVSEMAVVVGADLLPELLWLDRPVREGGLRWRGGRR